VIIARDGRVLALERRDRPGAWQLPQGGLERGEEPLEAVHREIAEETGLPAAALELVAACPELLAYELPPASRSDKTGRGQVQYWFLFRLIAGERQSAVTLGREFGAWRWMPFGTLAAEVVVFRRAVYRRLGEVFGAHLSAGAAPM
jgi:putative (di)nucleoside polyphosphate hydrolase